MTIKKEKIIMERQKRFVCLCLAAFTAAALLAGCGSPANSSGGNSSGENETAADSTITAGGDTGIEDSGSGEQEHSSETESVTELTVRFGDGGEPFTMHLYENDTAAAIAGYVGQSSWRLPIYHYDDYDNWEVMQYYDIPSRYEIPDNPEEVTSVAAGAVYYSEPNRIILFFHDAEISAEYTPVGYFEATDEFVEAVEENPVLEGWGNKIVLIE